MARHLRAGFVYVANREPMTTNKLVHVQKQLLHRQDTRQERFSMHASPLCSTWSAEGIGAQALSQTPAPHCPMGIINLPKRIHQTDDVTFTQRPTHFQSVWDELH